MNQPKNSRKNAEADTSKTTPEDNPFSTILKTGGAPKLGAKAQGMVLYEIAQNSGDDQLYFRIAGQSGGAGLHSKHWVPLNELFQLIESQGDSPWKSQVYKSQYPSGSANNQGFCASIVRDLGLAQKSESSIYLHILGDEYQQLKAELLALADKKTK